MSKHAYHQINNLNELINDNSLSLSNKCDYLLLYINQTFGEDINILKARSFFNELPSIFPYLYQSKIENEKDYYSLYNLFTPGYSMLNLFSVIIRPFIPETHHYMLDAQAISSLFTENTNSLLNSHHHVLKEFLGEAMIQDESINHIYQNNKCLLPLFEYFIVIFLISAKKIEYTNRKYLNVKKKSKGMLSSLFNLKRAIIQEDNEELLEELDVNRSFQYNFFKNILRRYMNFFYDNGMKTRLEFIYKAMNIVWLYDYSVYDIQRTESIIDKGRKTGFSKLFNMISSSHITDTSAGKTNRIPSIQYPNLLIVDCLIDIISFTYHNLRMENLSPYKTYLFSLINFSFENMSTFYVTDVNTGDIIRLWYTYITPWKIINKTGAYNQDEGTIMPFIYGNIPFYTELLNKSLLAFTSLRNDEQNLYELNKALELFSLQPEGLVVFKHLPIDQLHNFAEGNYKSFASHDYIEKELKCFGRNESNAKQTIYPFKSHIQGRQAAIKMIVNNNLIIQSLESTNEDDAKAKALIGSLKLSNDIIGNLYQINSEERSQFPKDRQIKYEDITKQIHLNRVIDNTKNPWNPNINTDDEIYGLFTLMKFFSNSIDKLKQYKGHTITKQTNLRPLCNKYTLLNSLTILLIVSLLSYVIYFTTNVIKINKH